MGHALIYKTVDPETLLLYSICVNSAAFKFINTVLGEDSMGEVGAVTSVQCKRLSPVIAKLAKRLQAFIAQGAGELTHCWTFITAACRMCEDLCLEAQVKACRTETDDDMEIYYCYTWCHILDKNYSMMQGKSRFLLEYDGLDAALSSPFNKDMSSLLSTYLHFVPIQAIYMSELHPDRISNKKSLLSRVEIVVKDLLERLEQLDGLADLSPPIAKLQTLFKSFLGLCEGLVTGTKETSPYAAQCTYPQQTTGQDRVVTSAPQPPVQLAGGQLQLPTNTNEINAEYQNLVQSADDVAMEFPIDNGLGSLDPSWDLFDTQPTMGWLDADFSFFDGNQ
ncbi:hypothetical protein IG631_10116 [Alternaria alternata]|nr:hypothetical protein IG631_10116 [Alternaria alternata]